MALTKSITELGSIPTPDAAFWNITDTVCDQNISNRSIRIRNSGCILYLNCKDDELIVDSVKINNSVNIMRNSILRITPVAKRFP